MNTVAPFRAWRYASSAGDPDLLIAPPYDVIGAELQSRLYARSRYNVVRVDLGITTPSDNDCDNRYTRAAAQLEEWKRSGVLVRDPAPTVTFVEEEFTGPDGRTRVRHGFLAVVRLHDFSEGVVFPHEQTFSGPKADRFELMETTAMSLSPVFLLYDLPGDEVTSAWAAGPGAIQPATRVADENGTVTKLWPVSDPVLLDAIGPHLSSAPLIIADGHHRYETALRYRDHRREQGGSGDASPAYEYVLAYLSNMADPGLAIYATHRLVTGVDPEKLAALPRRLAGTFTVEPLTPSGPGTTGIRASIEGYLAAHPRRAFGVWAPAAGAAYGVALVDQSALVAATPGRTATYRELDVTVLHSLVLEPGLGITSEGPAAEGNVAFFKNVDDAFDSLGSGEFQAGFFMNPTRLEQVREVAFARERMPQKATFFHPKLPTGLVFQDLVGTL